MLKSIFNKFAKRVIACPNCGQRSRVPVRPGKSLLITCPACNAKFEIKFENPLDSAKKQFKTPLQTFSSGLTLKQRESLKKYFPIFVALLVVLLFQTCFSSARLDTDNLNSRSYNRQSTVKDSAIFDM